MTVEMTNASAARLFVAVDPPVDVCEELEAWARMTVRGLGVGDGEYSSVRVLNPELLRTDVPSEAISSLFVPSRPEE